MSVSLLYYRFMKENGSLYKVKTVTMHSQCFLCVAWPWITCQNGANKFDWFHLTVLLWNFISVLRRNEYA